MPIQQKDMLDFSFEERSDVLTIPTPDLFSFDETLLYLTRSPAECLHVVVGCSIHKLIEVEGEAVWIVVSEQDRSALQIRFVHGVPRSEAIEDVVRYISEWLDLRTDLAPFYLMAEGDPLLGRLTRDYHGLRIIGVPDLFEALCWAVIGQQVNLPFAYTLKKRFVETYGKQVQSEGRTLWLFPKPGDIAEATVEDFKKLQFTGKKAEYILHIAQLMGSGELSKEALLASGDFAAAEQQLTAIRGIGPWTAHYVMMRCLRDPSAFPIGDAALQNALKQMLDMPQKPAAEEIRRIFTPWRTWEAYAVFYLWRSLSKSTNAS